MARDPNPDWRNATVVENRHIARGSVWLELEAEEDGLPAAYEPGHVLGLGLKRDDGETLRHAYTVTRGDPDKRRFVHIYRVIPDGRMTPLLSALKPGAAVQFHGPGHNPIQSEIDDEAESIIGLATGTGLGPLYGYAEKTLNEGETRPITLYIGMREQADICLRPEMRELAKRYPNFSFRYSITNPRPDWKGLKGRITESVPPLLEELGGLHFHLVGNGEMVHLVRKALYTAGLPKPRVSIETYFNHHAEPSPEQIDELAQAFKETA